MREQPLVQVLIPFHWLKGAWEGEGTGMYPTIEPFRFIDIMNFQVYTKIETPVVCFSETAYLSTPQGHDKIKHCETGYYRIIQQDLIELQVVHNTGRIEILQGRYTQVDQAARCFELHLASVEIYNPTTLTTVLASQRTLALRKETLHCTQMMQTANAAMAPHLDLTLQRKSIGRSEQYNEILAQCRKAHTGCGCRC
jgi:hypothetical protein